MYPQFSIFLFISAFLRKICNIKSKFSLAKQKKSLNFNPFNFRSYQVFFQMKQNVFTYFFIWGCRTNGDRTTRQGVITVSNLLFIQIFLNIPFSVFLWWVVNLSLQGVAWRPPVIDPHMIRKIIFQKTYFRSLIAILKHRYQKKPFFGFNF